MRDEALRDDFATDVVLLKYVGLNPVIVHGGGPDISEYMERLGMEVRFHEGLRVSDAATVEVAKMVLLGKVNSDIVHRLNRHGQPAVGLSGEDGTLFEVEPVANAEKVGFVGAIQRVDVDVLNHIAADYIPVIASAATDRDGNSYNVNADEAAGKVAAALGAYKAMFLTDVEGWLDDPEDPGSLISRGDGRRAGRARWRRSPAACGQSSAPASTRSPAGPSTPTSSTAAVPTVCCSSSSPRGHRHHDHGLSPRDARRRSRRSKRATSCTTYVRAPVVFVRGEGARLWDAEARSTSTSSPGSRSVRSATAIRPSSPRCASRPAT